MNGPCSELMIEDFLCLTASSTVAMTRAKRHLVSSKYPSSSSHLINFAQCIVGDSSTVCHGGSYLKKWLAWLEGNADVKYAGLE